MLKYNTAPIVSIIFSFAYPDFYAAKRWDPLHIASFAFMHMVLVSALVGLIMPRWFNVLVPASRKTEGDYPVMPGVVFSRANASGSLDIEGISQGAEGSGHDVQQPEEGQMWREEDDREKTVEKRQVPSE